MVHMVTWGHSSPRMMLRYSAPLYSPWPAGDQAQLRPCSPLRTEKAATPPENNGACPRGHRGHRAQQIARTPPCNAIMSSERPGQLIDLLLSMAQSWHMEPVEAARGKLQLGAGALEHTVQFSVYAYKGQVEEEQMYANLLCCFKDSTLKIGFLNCYSRIISSSVDLSTKLNIIYLHLKQTTSYKCLYHQWQRTLSVFNGYIEK